MRTQQFLTSFVLLALLAAPNLALSQEPDWGLYAQLLREHVSQGTRNGVRLALVDYQGLKGNGLIERSAEPLAQFDPARLAGREERVAFYINAYNLLAIKMVLDHFPVKSIKEAGSIFVPVWKKPTGRIGSKTVTLHEIEHQILRPMGEPRVHFAIVCASLSCPDLRPEPYTAARLEDQLDEQVKKFLGNETKGLRLEPGRIRVSKIFTWFEEDFERVGGVEAFIRRYRPELPALPVKADLPYDWSLNAAERARAGGKGQPASMTTAR